MEVINTFIGGIALLISGFILIRDYILPAKIKMFFGDSLQIVHADRNKIQINFNLTNPRNKLSVINKIKAVLSHPDGNTYKYTWNVFYKLDGNKALPDRFPTSIAVLAKNSVFQGIEFISDERFVWIEGEYEFNIYSWTNKTLDQNYNLSAKIVFLLSKEDADYLNNTIPTSSVTPMRPVRIIN